MVNIIKANKVWVYLHKLKGENVIPKNIHTEPFLELNLY